MVCRFVSVYWGILLPKLLYFQIYIYISISAEHFEISKMQMQMLVSSFAKMLTLIAKQFSSLSCDAHFGRAFSTWAFGTCSTDRKIDILWLFFFFCFLALCKWIWLCLRNVLFTFARKSFTFVRIEVISTKCPNWGVGKIIEHFTYASHLISIMNFLYSCLFFRNYYRCDNDLDSVTSFPHFSRYNVSQRKFATIFDNRFALYH